MMKIGKGKGGKPSKTGKPSGKGRDNNPPKRVIKKMVFSPPFFHSFASGRKLELCLMH